MYENTSYSYIVMYSIVSFLSWFSSLAILPSVLCRIDTVCCMYVYNTWGGKGCLVVVLFMRWWRCSFIFLREIRKQNQSKQANNSALAYAAPSTDTLYVRRNTHVSIPQFDPPKDKKTKHSTPPPPPLPLHIVRLPTFNQTDSTFMLSYTCASSILH